MNQEIRKKNLYKRNNLTEKEIREMSNRAIGQIPQFVYDEADAFLCYYPLSGEMDLRPLYEKLLSGHKHLFFPVTKEQDIFFYEITDLKDFIIGNFHVMEPADQSKEKGLDHYLHQHQEQKEAKTFETKTIVAFTPGLAFNETGARLGFGKGYYDRFFASCRFDLLKIGCSYDFQLDSCIEVNKYDVPMDALLTEKEWIRINV